MASRPRSPSAPVAPLVAALRFQLRERDARILRMDHEPLAVAAVSIGANHLPPVAVEVGHDSAGPAGAGEFVGDRRQLDETLWKS